MICICFLFTLYRLQYRNCIYNIPLKFTATIHVHACPYFICGDFTSRMGDEEDYIAGIYIVPERNVIDRQKNTYGAYLSRFLIDCNCCVLNGRNDIDDTFTYITTRGRSVVDYYIIPYDNLCMFSEFNVITATDVIEGCLRGNIESRLISDHSVLRCTLNLENVSRTMSNNSLLSKSFKKFDLSDIPEDMYLGDNVRSHLDTVIEQLESSVKS